MMTHFYHAVIDTQDLHMELEGLSLETTEKEELAEIMESTILHHIIDSLLDHLPEEEREVFLNNLMAEDNEGVIAHLKDKIELFEEKLTDAYQEIKQTLLLDLK
jgi:hypothetical protein